MKYQVLKNGYSIAVCNTPDEADAYYLEYDADEIRELADF